MATPVGLTAAQSCAAVRAGISAIEDLDFTLENEQLQTEAIAGCAVRGVSDGYVGLGRAARLATAALKDLAISARLSARELMTATLYLALPPAGRGGVDPQVSQQLGARIAQSMKVEQTHLHIRVYPHGHAAAAQALLDARSHVTQGSVQHAIVCGVDSLVEQDTLEFLLSKRRVKTGDRIDGFVPGEAAAGVLVERAATAEARGVNRLASIDAVGVAIEPITIWSTEPSAAIGLSDAVRQALGQLPDGGCRTRLVLSDLNGETYRAKEYGTTATRALSAIQGSWRLWHPADCIGDTGAASFTVSTCIGAHALMKGYAKSDSVLVLGSSDDGLRGAVALRRLSPEA
jgi:3-oxoacyl-[acyl-carrier-protein] synthase-1